MYTNQMFEHGLKDTFIPCSDLLVQHDYCTESHCCFGLHHMLPAHTNAVLMLRTVLSPKLVWSCAGHKEQLQWFHNYIVAVLSTPGQQDYPATYVLQVFDLRNKLIAISVPLAEVSRDLPLAPYPLPRASCPLPLNPPFLTPYSLPHTSYSLPLTSCTYSLSLTTYPLLLTPCPF